MLRTFYEFLEMTFTNYDVLKRRYYAYDKPPYAAPIHTKIKYKVTSAHSSLAINFSRGDREGNLFCKKKADVLYGSRLKAATTSLHQLSMPAYLVKRRCRFTRSLPRVT